MDLVAATSATHEVAKCLSSVKVSLDGDCKVSVTSTAAGGNFVPLLWAPSTAANYTYTQYMECPVDGEAVTPAAESAAARLAAIQTAFSNHIYGAGKPYTTTLTYSTGKVVAAADSQTFTYVITELTLAAVATDLGNAADLKVLTAAGADGLTDGTEYKTAFTQACSAGRYGFILNDNVKICPLCPAGTTGDGSACSACDAGTGKNAGVGATSCTQCDAGTYAAEGSSDCLPCPQHTYSAAGAGQCTTW